MNTSKLEITGNEYLIRLRKEDFDMPFIQNLLHKIQEKESFFSLTVHLERDDDSERRYHRYDSSLRFDRLDEK